MVGDFFVGQALGDERNELLLAAAQAQAPAVAATGKGRRIALEVAEQDGAKRARANGFAGMNGLHALENFVRGSIAQQVTVDPRAHTLQKFALVLAIPISNIRTSGAPAPTSFMPVKPSTSLPPEP